MQSENYQNINNNTVEFRKQRFPLPSDLAGKRGSYFRAALTFGWLKNLSTVIDVSNKA